MTEPEICPQCGEHEVGIDGLCPCCWLAQARGIKMNNVVDLDRHRVGAAHG